MKPVTPRRVIKVRSSDVAKAIARAKNFCPCDWQGEQIEILRITNVNKRWRGVNAALHRDLRIVRHKGLPYPKHATRDFARDVTDWSIYSGYTLQFSATGFVWNTVREDYFAHSPAAVWNGIRRETFHSFAEHLRSAYYSLDKTGSVPYRIADYLRDYKIVFVNDTHPDAEGFVE
jgi:hypothetical protein